MKRIRRLLTIGLLVAGFGLLLHPLTLVSADASTQTACNAISDGHGCASSGPSITDIVKTVVNILSFVVGFAAVLMIIIGGFKYITSNGDSNAITSAKNTLLYAIIGLVIVAMSQFIVQFVLNKSIASGCGPKQVLNSQNACVAK